MLKKLVLASNNAGKLREFSALLAPLGCQVIAQGELNVPEAEEPFHTFVENALAKARHASRLTGLPALADDSGLCVDALGGAPGVLSARFAGEPKSDARNNAALLAALDGKTPRSGHYYCVLVLVRHADDPQPIIADGVWRGQVLSAAQGDGGFGYDPLFQAQGESVSVAEMDAAAKNAVSHRGQAMRALAAKLAELGQA
ncbi:RdgB/HAM1 family non-canonical purine NTP pyrophosphatase [Rivihabitans pingtungensis]|uniref:dITP/XTP pyrophosphatase n=1 Tax=Rivihabitans pingtungensis TaxID=1054498 RepID=A0A318KXP8_9NEIS|nr:RdgB/HAM1 family non-canonical purine NTP pyrophosphatase [Rivihabitans pingtungensis]PXX81332.1 XTP/dITP diphosphohydrolase [Rivihabitans pingtungensis]